MFSKSNVSDQEVICSAVYLTSHPELSIELVSSFFGIPEVDLKWAWRNKLPELDSDLYNKVIRHHAPVPEPSTCPVRNTPFGVNGVA